MNGVFTDYCQSLVEVIGEQVVHVSAVQRSYLVSSLHGFVD